MTQRQQAKRELLTRILLDMKAEGFRVFINKQDKFTTSSYGLITNGEDIVYIQFDEYHCGYRMAYEYVPSRAHGRGCSYHDMGMGVSIVDKEEVQKVINYGHDYTRRNHVQRYSGIDHFMKDDWHKRVYAEL